VNVIGFPGPKLVDAARYGGAIVVLVGFPSSTSVLQPTLESSGWKVGNLTQVGHSLDMASGL